MTLVVDVAVEVDQLPLARSRVVDIARSVLRAERVRHALLSVAFVSDRAIAAMNRRHLRRRGATDVIAFGFERATAAEPVVGDIYIAPAVARRNAAHHRTGIREELARLVVHGTLHVLGHAHPDGEGRERSIMWERQERLLARLRTAGQLR